jgi:hypothetical protein
MKTAQNPEHQSFWMQDIGPLICLKRGDWVGKLVDLVLGLWSLVLLSVAFFGAT